MFCRQRRFSASPLGGMDGRRSGGLCGVILQAITAFSLLQAAACSGKGYFPENVKLRKDLKSHIYPAHSTLKASTACRILLHANRCLIYLWKPIIYRGRVSGHPASSPSSSTMLVCAVIRERLVCKSASRTNSLICVHTDQNSSPTCVCINAHAVTSQVGAAGC